MSKSSTFATKNFNSSIFQFFNSNKVNGATQCAKDYENNNV